jgi:RNA polymerase sigma factor (sigma-70 family)
MPMQDREVVAAVAAGDPAGIAEAYDKYAMALYAYCRSLLPRPADAADAVQDTFLTATVKLGGLRDAGKLRSWLYAVARNECLRRMRSQPDTSSLDEAEGLVARQADVAGPDERAEQAELRRLVRDAISGLNPGERDVIELSLVHGLDGGELADALGVSRKHAHALASRARRQLERSLGALVVARTGRESCPDLDGLLAGWDGRLTVLMRKRISRHIEQCEICHERKRRELVPALFVGALPLVALMPGFREHVLRLCADATPAGLARRAGVAARAGEFGQAGFPRSASVPGGSARGWATQHSHALVAAAVTAAAAAGVAAVLVIGGGAAPSHAPAAGARGSAGARVAMPARGGPSDVPGAVPGGPGSSPASGGIGKASPASPATGATRDRSTSPAHSATPAGSGSATATSGPSSPSASSSSPAVQGTLTVSLGRLVLVAVNGQGVGTFTLTASGGPVDYSISAASGLSVSPASGSLSDGASATITVTSSSLVTLDEKLTVNPGGYVVTVVLNVSL